MRSHATVTGIGVAPEAGTERAQSTLAVLGGREAGTSASPCSRRSRKSRRMGFQLLPTHLMFAAFSQQALECRKI